MTTTRKIIKYAVLPGFIPRILALFTSGFSTLSFYIALVYSMVGLLPKTHPYLQHQNIGKYGIRHVIYEAAKNLEFSRNKLDQVIIFFTILIGMVAFIVQIVLLGIALFASQEVLAFSFSVGELFQNPNATTNSQGPEQDLAFILFDRIFGLVGIYDSCISVGVACESTSGQPMAESIGAYPYPFHEALHSMLHFYSLGIMFVAAMMLIYFTITVVGETAATGTPFGQRFNRAWAPIRIVLFAGMLTPMNTGTGINQGLNGAQIATFWVAKHGSNFATNAWAYFNTTLTSETFLGPQANIIAKPNTPEMGNLAQFVLTAKTCTIIENTQRTAPPNIPIKPYIVRPQPPNYATPPAGTVSPNAMEYLTTNFSLARSFSMEGDIKIRFGSLGIDQDGDGNIDEPHASRGGHILPVCGDITVPTTNVFEPGAAYIAEEYYELIKTLWTDPTTNEVAECLAQTYNQSSNPTPPPTCTLPDPDYATYIQDLFKNYAELTIENGVNLQRTSGDFLVPTELLEKGWVGAAIWYNRLAQMNGAIVNAVASVPRQDRYPMAMEFVAQERALNNSNISGKNRYNLILSDGSPVNLPDNQQDHYPAMYEAYAFWHDHNASMEAGEDRNAFIAGVNLLLGTEGIFDMRDPDNANVHPLAQLSQIGKSMINAVVRNTAYAGAGVIGSGLAGIIDPFPAEIASVISQFMMTLITSSIGIAVILYYVLPLLPFIYFIFAAGGWIKSIFEAIVAMPLWALAHLRIDGEGIPGQDAANGYFLLFEIFIRPILIVFSLICSINIFAALVVVLNSVFDMVIVNVGGATMDGASPMSLEQIRGPVDEFFFTAMYAVICYLMGISCFKLVDMIPNNILRWIGANVATFQENAGDPAGQLTSNVYRGSILVGNQVSGMTQGDLAAIMATR